MPEVWGDGEGGGEMIRIMILAKRTIGMIEAWTKTLSSFGAEILFMTCGSF